MSGGGDVGDRFREAARLLDGELGRLLASPPFGGCEVRDLSNPSGFEKSGHPYFLWRKLLVRDSEEGGEIRRATVEVSYLEPPDPGEDRLVTVASRAEVFQEGSLSRVDVRSEEEVSLERVREEGLAAAATEALERAREVLARRGAELPEDVGDGRGRRRGGRR